MGKTFRQLREAEQYEKLSEYGPQVHRETYGRCVRDLGSKVEQRVFSQELSEAELKNTGDGFCGNAPNSCFWWA